MEELILSKSGFILFLSFFVVGALGSLVFHKKDGIANELGSIFAIFGSFFGLIFAVFAFQSSKTLVYQISSVLFPSFSMTFAVDKLSAFFIFVISLVAFFCSVYALGYVKHFYGRYNIGLLGFLYNVFILGMLGVVSASNFIFFLVVWELMALASYFLVIYENKEKKNIKAGYLYFVMTHVGTIFITLAILLAYKFTGSFDFSVIKENVGNIPGFAAGIIFVFSILGLGVKSGIIPLHIWLPEAHPAAPSHISALMSGVMIKTGIYMMARIFFDIFNNVPMWWGIVIISAGAVSALLGVLYAITEHDLKRLLAFHSIENIGIILLGFGSALLFLSSGMPALAMLGFVAALFHVLNHAIFKSLLFLGAGSVVLATHTKNIEEYGGLIKKMPYTAVFFLVGSMAISALPPFNGFFSEWMTFQSLFAGVYSIGNFSNWIFLLAAGALAASGGLALACFVKVCGTTFLARPRSDEAKKAKESPASMKFAMAGLALCALFFGIFSGPAFAKLEKVIVGFNGFSNISEVSAISSNIRETSIDGGFASLSSPVIFLSIIISILMVFFAVRYFVNRNQKVNIGRTWDCGTDATSRMEITSTAFSRSLVLIFKKILKPTKQTEIEYRDANIRYLPKSRTISLHFEDIYQNYIYSPIGFLTVKLSEMAKQVQSGNLNAYILYLFLTLLALLFFI